MSKEAAKFHAAFHASLPPGSIITSIGDRDLERSSRVRGIRAVPAAERAPFDAEDGWHLWGEYHDDECPGADELIYRTRSRRLAEEMPGGEPYPVNLDDQFLICVAPVHMTEAEAQDASAMTLTSAEMICSVREERGRWIYETGAGSMLRPWGAADTREEAEVMATAILYRAWLAAVERIMRARGGSLRWGQPIVAPRPVTLREPVTLLGS